MARQIGYAGLRNKLSKDLSRTIKAFEKKAGVTIKYFEATIHIQRLGEELFGVRITHQQTIVE